MGCMCWLPLAVDLLKGAISPLMPLIVACIPSQCANGVSFLPLCMWSITPFDTLTPAPTLSCVCVCVLCSVAWRPTRPSTCERGKVLLVLFVFISCSFYLGEITLALAHLHSNGIIYRYIITYCIQCGSEKEPCFCLGSRFRSPVHQALSYNSQTKASFPYNVSSLHTNTRVA